MATKKIIFKTIIITLIVQLLIVWSVTVVVYYNYDKVVKTNSWISTKTNLKTLDFSEFKIPEKINDDYILYQWNLWYIKHIDVSKWKEWFLLWKKSYNYVINKEFLKKVSIINILDNKKILDKYIYKFLYNLDNNIETELTNLINFAILLDCKIDKNTILKEIDTEYNNKIKEINKKISEKDYKKLSLYLEKVEKDYFEKVKSIPGNIFIKNNILADNRLQYVINKLYSEPYYSKIQNTAKLFNIDEKLIISSIWVEQLRYLLTLRGYTKSLIKQNKYLTNFSKFSFWLWWIKVPTARKIQNQIKINNPNIYNQYFKIDDWVSDSIIIQKLEKYSGWILYAGALISIIENRWKKWWMDLNNNPGVIITLYNMWNPIKKIPHKTPDVWGSILNINWKKLYFWEMWHLIYHYLNYYIENKKINSEIVFIKNEKYEKILKELNTEIEDDFLKNKNNWKNINNELNEIKKRKILKKLKQKILERNRLKKMKIIQKKS